MPRDNLCPYMHGSKSTFDLVLDLCRNRHCQIILGIFADQQRTLTRADLVKTIVKYDHQVPLHQMSEAELKEVHILLHHKHIPKMKEAGLVEYNRETTRVEPTEMLDEVVPHVTDILEIDPNIDPPIEL